MNERSVPLDDVAVQYLGSDPHREKWTLYSGAGADGEIVLDTIVEGGIYGHGNMLSIVHRIELDSGAFEVTVSGVDLFCDGTSYDL